MSTERVRDYYEGFDEWARLDTDAGRVEFARVCRIFDRWLGSPGHILDLGGGPGRYAIELCKRGHRVTLVDLSPRQVEIARERVQAHGVASRVEATLCGDATDLGRFAADRFDAAMAFGPFYHLTGHDDRVQAARETARVVKRGGLVLAMFIPRLAGVAGLLQRAARDPEQVPPHALRAAFDSGVFDNGVDRGFQSGYFAEPEELRRLFADAGLSELETVSVRGLAAEREQAYLALRERTPELHQVVDSVLDSIASDPGVIQLGGHALYVGRKPD